MHLKASVALSRRLVGARGGWGFSLTFCCGCGSCRTMRTPRSPRWPAAPSAAKKKEQKSWFFRSNQATIQHISWQVRSRYSAFAGQIRPRYTTSFTSSYRPRYCTWQAQARGKNDKEQVRRRATGGAHPKLLGLLRRCITSFITSFTAWGSLHILGKLSLTNKYAQPDN